MTRVALLTFILSAALLPRVWAAFDPEYYTRIWSGTCATGQLQSPINLESKSHSTRDRHDGIDTFGTLATVSSIKLLNTGHGMELVWADIKDQGSVSLAVVGDTLNGILSHPYPSGDVARVAVTPVQLHFHDTSEHTFDGRYYAAEMHIVAAVSKGAGRPEWGCDAFWEDGQMDLSKLKADTCGTVFSVPFTLNASALAPTWLQKLLDTYTSRAGSSTPITGDLDLNSVLPTGRSHYMYGGSVTTPPCTEGLRWHVFSEPIAVPVATLQQLQTGLAQTFGPEGSQDIANYRTNNRLTQDANGRPIFQCGQKEKSWLQSFIQRLLMGRGGIQVAEQLSASARCSCW